MRIIRQFLPEFSHEGIYLRIDQYSTYETCLLGRQKNQLKMEIRINDFNPF